MKKAPLTLRKVIIYTVFGLGTCLLVLWIILWVGFDSTIQKEFRESEAFQVTKEQIASDSVLISSIGKIERFGDNIGGSYKPESHANFQFKVFGEKGTIRVRCRLVFQGSLWVVESLEY